LDIAQLQFHETGTTLDSTAESIDQKCIKIL
jgi:hypothetical protein